MTYSQLAERWKDSTVTGFRDGLPPDDTISEHGPEDAGLADAVVVIIDKRATDEERVATLAGAISRFDTAELELAQKVRDCIHMYEDTGPRRAA